jgi:hypothetical protein
MEHVMHPGEAAGKPPAAPAVGDGEVIAAVAIDVAERGARTTGRRARLGTRDPRVHDVGDRDDARQPRRGAAHQPELLGVDRRRRVDDEVAVAIAIDVSDG